MTDVLIGENIGTVIRSKIFPATQSLHIFSPFITLGALEFLLADIQISSVTIYTTWDADDIASGVSDVSIYPYLKKRGFQLFLCRRLHMKGVLVDSESFILSTSNITQNGLGLREYSNIECATYVSGLGVNDRLWLMGLIQKSFPVTDAMYQKASTIPVAQNKLTAELILDWNARDEAFLVSRLPCSASPKAVMKALEILVLEGVDLGSDDLIYAIHDISLYALKVGESPAINFKSLKENFLLQPFIQAFIAFVKEKPRYFGETKEWIQNTCVDDPAPYKRDLTARIQILFNWMVELAPEQYQVTRPNYSECLAYIG